MGLLPQRSEVHEAHLLVFLRQLRYAIPKHIIILHVSDTPNLPLIANHPNAILMIQAEPTYLGA